jgi:hypothetical protein
MNELVSVNFKDKKQHPAGQIGGIIVSYLRVKKKGEGGGATWEWEACNECKMLSTTNGVE